MMQVLFQDIQVTLRSFRSTWRLSTAAVACVVLGVGSAVFILTVASALLLDKAPFPDADRLIRIWVTPQGTQANRDLSYLDATDIAAAARSVDALEMALRTRVSMTTGDGTERVRGESVTPGYFGLLGIRPVLGRVFTPDEYEAGAAPVAIISHALWTRTFGRRPDVIGEPLQLRPNSGNQPAAIFTIIGVMPPDFAGTVDTDVSEFWLPFEHYMPRTILEQRRTRMAWVLARLRPGTSIASAQSEMTAIGRQLAAEYVEDYRDLSLTVQPVGETWRERFRSGLIVLTAAAILLLLIACANIAHLLLARLAQREQEFKLRAALGAQPGRIIRHLITESFLLAGVGGVLGTLAAIGGVKAIAAARVFQLPAYVSFDVNVRVVAMSLGLVVLTTMLSGALPAWLGGRLGRGSGLVSSSRGSIQRGQRRSIDILVSAEVAFSFMLLVAGTLMFRSYLNLVRSDVGFRVENLQRLAISLDPRAFPDRASRLEYARDTRASLAALPGVQGVSFMSGVLPPWFDNDVAVAVGGEVRRDLAAVALHAVDENFFRVLSIPIRQGRGFAEGDRDDAPPVVVVSRSIAEAIAAGLGGEPVVGSTIAMARDRQQLLTATPARIVGIVEDVTYNGPRSDRAADYDVYIPFAQAPVTVLSIAVATSAPPAVQLNAFQRILAERAPTSPIHYVSTMEEELTAQFGDARLYAWLTGIFSASALLLVGIGIYGVMSNAVARRYSEIGIRMAIGAQAYQIVALILKQASIPLGAGLGFGILGALASATLATSLVYGMTPSDPATFIAAAVIIATVAAVACYLPARRATRLDPRSVLSGS